jgi:hypothetical protein
MATTDTRDMDMGIIREATTATTAATHITEPITLGGRTITEAIELTSIIRIITTATKARVGAKKLAGLEQLQASFFYLEAACPIPQITPQRYRGPRPAEHCLGSHLRGNS